MKRHFLKSAKISLVLVYLVIVAGALVRMTGSGMGCPDWPKCFGYYIPPTELKELLFTPEKQYDKGQVIIKDETLLVAKTDFKATQNFENSNWEKYTKHDYAIFNPFHTWVEYLNRLVGALAGLACLATFLLSFWFWKEKRKLVYLTLMICFLMGFQAWLGKTVVDSVLNPVKITTHMLAALLIVSFQLVTIYWMKEEEKTIKIDTTFKNILAVAIVLTLIQIILGTSVREHVDTIADSGSPKLLWLENPSVQFYIHRTFSLVILLTNLFLFVRNKKMNLGLTKINLVLLLLAAEIITGITMYYFDFPFGTQAIHIILATILFGIQFYLILETRKKTSVTIQN